MSGNILEQFFIQIGLDAEDLTKGEKAITAAILGIQNGLNDLVSGFNLAEKQSSEAQKRLANNSDKLHSKLQDSAKQTKNVFAGLKGELLAFTGIGLSIGGMVKFIDGMTRSVMGLSIQSKMLGMAPKELDGWQHAAEAVGSTKESITNSLASAQNAVNRVKATGNYDDTIYQAAAYMHVDYANAKDGKELLTRIIKALPNLTKEQQYTYGEMAHLDPAIIQNSVEKKFLPEVQNMISKSMVTDEQIRKNQQFTEQMATLSTNFDNMKRTLEIALLPYAERFVTFLNQWAEWINKHPKEVQAWIDKIQSSISSLVKEVGGWQNAIKIVVGFKLASWLWALVSPVSALGKALTGIVLNPAAMAALTKMLGPIALLAPTNNTPTTDGEFKQAGVERWKPNALSKDYDSAWRKSHNGTTAKRLAPYTDLFSKLEAQYHLPPDLLRTIAAQESSGDKNAINAKSGARGMFQFMPATGKEYGLTLQDMLDPNKEAVAAAKKLHGLLMKYHHDIGKAAAAYNWGEGNLDKYLNGTLKQMPIETKDYINSLTTGSALKASSNNITNNHSQNTDQYHFHGDVSVNSNPSSARSLAKDITEKTSIYVLSN